MKAINSHSNLEAEMKTTTTTTETYARGEHPFEKAGLGVGPFRCVAVERRTYQACPGAPVQPGGSCDYCGTGIVYHFTIQGTDGGEFVVGSDCVAKTGDRKLRRQVDGMKRDALRRAKHEARKVAWRREAWAKMREALAANPELGALLKTDHRIVRDIRSRFCRFGTVSPAQLALVKKLAAEADKPETPKVPVPEVSGRTRISGVVISARYQDSAFGTQAKMLVEVTTEAGAYRLWGSIPGALLDTVERIDDLRGTRVALDAKIQRSDDDEAFGFFSRPTKPEVLPETSIA